MAKKQDVVGTVFLLADALWPAQACYYVGTEVLGDI